MTERVYHPYWKWEEIDANMWGSVSDRKLFLKKAVEFTGDHKKYGRFMRRVAREWFYSCQNALSDINLNRRAWIGHAACAMALGCPEDITREAWGKLTLQQQNLANAEADHAIKLWESDNGPSEAVHRDMAVALL